MTRSMTYGQMPDWEEWDRAFDREIERGRYNIRLGASDSRAADGTPIGDGDYSSKDLYNGVTALVRKWQGGKGSGRFTRKQRDAAGEFASSIMETLGFEWI